MVRQNRNTHARNNHYGGKNHWIAKATYVHDQPTTDDKNICTGEEEVMQATKIKSRVGGGGGGGSEDA
jgi:hypothetical protein